MRGGIQLPDFTDLGALPAADWGVWFLGWSGMGMPVLLSPVADLSAIQFESVKPQDLGSREAIGARRGAGQSFYQELKDGLRPRFCMVSARGTGQPEMRLFPSAGAKVVAQQNMKTAAGKLQSLGRFGSGQSVLVAGF